MKVQFHENRDNSRPGKDYQFPGKDSKKDNGKTTSLAIPITDAN